MKIVKNTKTHKKELNGFKIPLPSDILQLIFECILPVSSGHFYHDMCKGFLDKEMYKESSWEDTMATHFQ